MTQACQNTDRELWRERPGDYYSPSIHVTAGGGIGINVGGTVYVKTAEQWHALAGGMFRGPAAPPSERLSDGRTIVSVGPTREDDRVFRYERPRELRCVDCHAVVPSGFTWCPKCCDNAVRREMNDPQPLGGNGEYPTITFDKPGTYEIFLPGGGADGSTDTVMFSGQGGGGGAAAANIWKDCPTAPIVDEATPCVVVPAEG